MLSPVQVFATSDAEVALREGISNFVLVTLGENLRPTIMCENTGRIESDATIWRVTAFVMPPSLGRIVTFIANVPVSSPDASNGGTRIADRGFAVRTDDYLQISRFYAWCECNPNLGTMIVVRQVTEGRKDRYLVGGGIDDEVEYRGEYARLPKWAKAEVKKHLRVKIPMPE